MLYVYTGATPTPFQFSAERSGALVPGAVVEIERTLVNASAFDRLRASRKLIVFRQKASPPKQVAKPRAKPQPILAKVESTSVAPALEPELVPIKDVNVDKIRGFGGNPSDPETEEVVHSIGENAIHDAQDIQPGTELEASESVLEHEPVSAEVKESEDVKVGELPNDEVEREEATAEDTPPAASRIRVKRRVF